MTNSINTTTSSIIVIADHVIATVRKVVKEYVENGNGIRDIDEIGKWSLRRLGVEVTLWKDAPEIWVDDLFDNDEDGTYLTWAGSQLTRTVHSWDYSGQPLDDADLVTFGDPHYGYQCRVLSKELSLEALIEVHKVVYTMLPDLIKAVEDDIASKKRFWGANMNHQLEEVGCTKAEIQAWWSLQWKREWSPEQWKRVCSTLTDAQVAAAMAAHSHGYLEAMGVNLGKSFPRTMDVIEAIGKSRRLSPNRVKNWNKAEEGVIPSAVEKDGSRKWSF